jgi:hypothetical protein
MTIEMEVRNSRNENWALAALVGVKHLTVVALPDACPSPARTAAMMASPVVTSIARHRRPRTDNNDLLSAASSLRGLCNGLIKSMEARKSPTVRCGVRRLHVLQSMVTWPSTLLYSSDSIHASASLTVVTNQQC